MRYIFFIFFVLINSMPVIAQPAKYTVANIHAHNDYQYNIPFEQAHRLALGSVEVDLVLLHDTLFVAHAVKEIHRGLVFENAYLQKINNALQRNNNYVFADSTRVLQLLIDIKTDSIQTLDAVIRSIRNYPALIDNPSIRFVITGRQPQPSLFKTYPSFIFFDGNINNAQHLLNIDRIGLFSDNLKKYTQWNGKGVLPNNDLMLVKQVIEKVHKLQKPIRFWGAPDNINTWYQLMELGTGYINTDHITEAGRFMNTLPATTSLYLPMQHEYYTPAYTVDTDTGRVTNIILIIGDGTGLTQWYAGYTGNKGKLNVFNMRTIGLSITNAADSYITDSGAGATAMATGNKTNNRFIGVDAQGRSLRSLTEILAAKHMRTAIITSGPVTDATPAAFYSHNSERSDEDSIAADLLKSNLDILMGSGTAHFTQRKDGRNLEDALRKKGYSVIHKEKDLDTVLSQKLIFLDERAGMPALKGRGGFLTAAADYFFKQAATAPAGSFAMIEGAQIDYAGHENNLSWLVEEVKDLDHVIGKAIRFADTHKGTLVIVTADHETGGLSLLNGNINKGSVGGQFTSDDHSAVCVPVFAYGPQSNVFSGVYANTEIFHKIIRVLAANQ